MHRNTKIHLPISNKGRKVKIETELPVIFLAGPIRNAPKWQEEAIKILLEKNENVFVASPTRKVHPHLMPFMEVDKDEYEVFPRQRAWEQYYLNTASQKGCIIFNLPKEAEVKEFPDKIYAHITMMELGEWIARCKQDKEINLVICTDGNFSEWSTIEFEIKTELPMVPIVNSLEKAIETALKFCKIDAVTAKM